MCNSIEQLRILDSGYDLHFIFETKECISSLDEGFLNNVTVLERVLVVSKNVRKLIRLVAALLLVFGLVK